MESWEEVAIDRMNETIKDIKEFGTTSTEDCPVCEYMKKYYNIISDFSYTYPCTDSNFLKCPAWKSCKRFLSILEMHTHKEHKSMEMIEQLLELMESLE